MNDTAARGAILILRCGVCEASAVYEGDNAEGAREAARARGWVIDAREVCPKCALVVFPDPWGRYAVAESADHPAATSRPRPTSTVLRSRAASARQVEGVVAVLDVGRDAASSAGPAGAPGGVS